MPESNETFNEMDARDSDRLQQAIRKDAMKQKRRLFYRPIKCTTYRSFVHMFISFIAQWIGIIGGEVLEFGVDVHTKIGLSHMRVFYGGEKQLCAVVNASGIHMIDIHNCVCVLQGMAVTPDENAFDRLVDLMLQDGDHNQRVEATLSCWVECRKAACKETSPPLVNYPTSPGTPRIEVENPIHRNA